MINFWREDIFGQKFICLLTLDKLTLLVSASYVAYIGEPNQVEILFSRCSYHLLLFCIFNIFVWVFSSSILINSVEVLKLIIISHVLRLLIVDKILSIRM